MSFTATLCLLMSTFYKSLNESSINKAILQVLTSHGVFGARTVLIVDHLAPMEPNCIRGIYAVIHKYHFESLPSDTLTSQEVPRNFWRKKQSSRRLHFFPPVIYPIGRASEPLVSRAQTLEFRKLFSEGPLSIRHDSCFVCEWFPMIRKTIDVVKAGGTEQTLVFYVQPSEYEIVSGVQARLRPPLKLWHVCFNI